MVTESANFRLISDFNKQKMILKYLRFLYYPRYLIWINLGMKIGKELKGPRQHRFNYAKYKMTMEPTVRQIIAFNSQDLETFLDCYTDVIKVYMLQTNQLLTDGIEQLSETMKTSFDNNPNSKSTILSTLNQGNLVIQNEEAAILREITTQITIFGRSKRRLSINS